MKYRVYSISFESAGFNVYRKVQPAETIGQFINGRKEAMLKQYVYTNYVVKSSTETSIDLSNNKQGISFVIFFFCFVDFTLLHSIPAN